MGIAFNEQGLHSFAPPVLVQEFFNHNATLFKIYVMGEHIHVEKKKSLPNLDSKCKFAFWQWHSLIQGSDGNDFL
jgi:hypothetical protein